MILFDTANMSDMKEASIQDSYAKPAFLPLKKTY